MKKKILIGAGIALALIVLIIVLCLIFKAKPMVTQPKEAISAITVTFNPWDVPEDEFDATTLSVMNVPQKADHFTIHYVLEETAKRRNIKLKGEEANINSAFEIVITYQDGSQDKIFSGDESNSTTIYRCLNPEAAPEKQKFVTGTSESVVNYINSLR